MTNRDYKEGFDGGIDFALTFVGEAYGTKFADLNELVAFIERIEQAHKAAQRTVLAAFRIGQEST
jgi:hypothetical protein